MTEASILCDKLLRLTRFSHFYRSWRTDFSLPVFMIDTFFALRSFLVEEQNFQFPLCACLLLTWRARVKRNPLVTVKIMVAGLSWPRNECSCEYISLHPLTGITQFIFNCPSPFYGEHQFILQCILAVLFSL